MKNQYKNYEKKIPQKVKRKHLKYEGWVSDINIQRVRNSHLAVFFQNSSCSHKSNKLISSTIRSIMIDRCPRHNVTPINNILKKLRLIPEKFKQPIYQFQHHIRKKIKLKRTHSKITYRIGNKLP